ncbi:hypothetical protein B7G68_05495 [Caulobacter segnis]|uniref:Uncharacterized protein n=1 Tax=Caulobacter segnis TaxID=88688 RepID=A0ABN5IQR3_9CAUL|nr:hypothetical protein B7G68_05495 [Caulobacter segnis]
MVVTDMEREDREGEALSQAGSRGNRQIEPSAASLLQGDDQIPRQQLAKRGFVRAPGPIR